MTNLLTAAEFKAVMPIGMSDDDLDDVIERVEAEVNAIIGAPYSDALELTETYGTTGSGVRSLFVERPISSVTSITEYDAFSSDATSETLTEGTDFYVWSDRGQIDRIDASWGARVVVVYVPTDRRTERKAMLIDLVRLALSRSGYRQEQVGGEYSYTSLADYEQERNRIIRRFHWYTQA